MDLFFPLMLALLAIFMFFSFRNQKKRAAAMAEMQSEAVDGARVQLHAGIFGTVVGDPEGETVDVEIAPGVVTTWNKLAIREVVKDTAVEDDETTDLDDDHDEDFPDEHSFGKGTNGTDTPGDPADTAGIDDSPRDDK